MMLFMLKILWAPKASDFQNFQTVPPLPPPANTKSCTHRFKFLTQALCLN